MMNIGFIFTHRAGISAWRAGYDRGRPLTVDLRAGFVDRHI